jgi:thioredoxin reductase (NADPH)
MTSTTSIQEYQTDVAVIGAGPTGLFAVFQCGMLGMKCHVVDALDEIGGQCTALYPEKPIYDIPGHSEISAGDLITNLEHQAAPFGPVYHLGQLVETLEPAPDGGWVLGTSKGVCITARAVIIAAGGGAFGPNRPPLPGIETYEGKSVFYLVKRRADFSGKKVVIAGGGDSAVDWALSLAEVAAHVMVVHRRPKFRAVPESAARLQEMSEKGEIELVVPYQLCGLEGENGVLSAVRVATLDGEERSLEADVLLPFYGLSSSLGPIADWGLGAEGGAIPVAAETFQTSQPGIFAVGDVAALPGKLKLILSGFAEAASAAHAAWSLVHPGEELHFQYSTTQGVPEASKGD